MGFGDGPNLRSAKRVAARMFGGSATVESLPCSRQQNGFDCGMYVVQYSQMIVDRYLTVGSIQRFRNDRQWRLAVQNVAPGVIAAKRQQIVSIFQDGVVAGVGRRQECNNAEQDFGSLNANMSRYVMDRWGR